MDVCFLCFCGFHGQKVFALAVTADALGKNTMEVNGCQMSMVRFSVQQRLPVALWIHGLQVTQSPLRRRWLGLQKLSHGPDS